MAERDLSSRLRRAVQENNLPLVRRLVQRTGMRNPDPDHKRYTSLAWAASLGNEETFEFLLGQGHDDEERSLDIDNDTILILLAETKGASVTSPYRSMPEGPTIQAALRMARLYHERYPETKDWSNHKGRTALHVAALKGNEELSGMLCDLGADYDLTDNDGNTPLHYASAWGHVPIVQLLIERGCQYTVKNNDGFTASDYAYSYNTKETLQSTARAQYETLKNKRSKRNMIQVSASRNGSSRELPSPTPPPVPAKTRRSSQDLTPQSNRIRSGSGASASFSTGTSDSGDYVDSIRHKPSYSSLSTAASSSPSDPLAPGGFFRGQTDSSRGSSSNGTLHSPGASNASSLHPGSTGLSHALSPVATRMRAQDADAMEKYMASRTRGRSGSADTGPDFKPTHSATPSNASANMAYPNYMSSGPSANGDDISALENMHLSGSVAPRRRLRPSQSASQLNAAPSPPLLNTNVPREFGGARARAGTTPVEQTSDAPLPPPKGVALTPPSDRMLFNSPTQATPPSRPSFSREDSSRRERQDYTGPSRAYATFPEPPPPPPEHSKTLPPIVPAPLRRETAENVKTPTQPSARRMPFKLTKGSSGSIDNSTYRNGTLPPPPAALPNRGDGKF